MRTLDKIASLRVGPGNWQPGRWKRGTAAGIEQGLLADLQKACSKIFIPAVFPDGRFLKLPNKMPFPAYKIFMKNRREVMKFGRRVVMEKDAFGSPIKFHTQGTMIAL